MVRMPTTQRRLVEFASDICVVRTVAPRRPRVRSKNLNPLPLRQATQWPCLSRNEERSSGGKWHRQDDSQV